MLGGFVCTKFAALSDASALESSIEKKAEEAQDLVKKKTFPTHVQNFMIFLRLAVGADGGLPANGGRGRRQAVGDDEVSLNTQ